MRKSVYDLGDMETLLEGKFRPGHFQGVCQVVHQLLAQVNAHDLFLGQKDYQQCMVIDRLMQQTGFKETVTLHICPTLRETDGLAMSSRNRRFPHPLLPETTAAHRQSGCITSNGQRSVGTGRFPDGLPGSGRCRHPSAC